MLGSIARAGRHVASARPAFALRQPRLVSAVRRSHGVAEAQREVAEAAESTEPGERDLHVESQHGEAGATEAEKHRRTTERIHISGTPRTLSDHKSGISGSHKIRVDRHIASIQERRRRERELRLEQDGMEMRAWPEVLNLLQSNLPQNPKRNHTRTMFVKIPLHAERTYKHSPRVVFTEMLLKFNCMTRLIHLYSAPVDGELVSRYVVLKGPPSTIDAARAYLYSLYNALVPVHVAEARSVSKSPNARCIFSAWTAQIQDNDLTLDSISEPEDMTVLSFANYVEQLVSTRSSRLNLKTTIRNDDFLSAQHHQQVAERLVDLFKKHEHRSSWSLYAALTTIRYLGKHRLLPSQRQVFQALQHVGEIKSPEIFTAMLDAAAKAQSLKYFAYVVDMMLSAGFRPGWEVWVSFARLMQRYDADVADAVLKAMKDCGFLEAPAVRIQMAETMCEQHYTEWIESGGTTEMFTGIYDRLWDGARWFTHSSAHTMLTYHARRGQSEQAVEVLRSYKLAGGKFKLGHLEVLLRNARKQGSLRMALAFVDEILTRRSPLVPSQQVYEDLFMAAMDQCYLNVACAVWQVAFAHGHISFAAQQRVRRCFYRPKDAEAMSLRHEFDVRAGDAILALMIEIVYNNRTAATNEHFPEPEALSVQRSPRKNAQLLERLLLVPQRFSTTTSLPELLRSAYQRDVEARRQRVIPALEEIMRVELKPLETSRHARLDQIRQQLLEEEVEHPIYTKSTPTSQAQDSWDANPDDTWADEIAADRSMAGGR